MKKILIVGVGSILRGDDGVGPRVIDVLEKDTLPRGVELHSGDISGLDLLKYFPGQDRVVIVDAADMKETPGTIRVFNSREIRKSDFNDKFSTHGLALFETLTLAEELDICRDIVIVGIQPENTSFKLSLTASIEKRIPAVIEEVKKLIA